MSDDSFVTNVPWAWAAVIEFLAASPSMDKSVLFEVIEKAPEIPDDLGKNMRERVALLCLEDLFGPSAGCGNDDTFFAPDAKIRIDTLKCCEDVLKDILHETSGSILRGDGLTLVKWDLKSFIHDKKLSLPETSLQQLKETLLESTCSDAAFLKEISGLEFSVAKGTCTVQEMAENNDLLPTKRLRAELAAENTQEGCHKDQSSLHGSEDLYPKVKRVKDACVQVDHGDGTCPGRKSIRDLSDRQAQVTAAEVYQLKKDNMGTSHENNVSKSIENAQAVLQRPQQSDLRLNASDKMHEFLRAQGTFIYDSFLNTECTEQSICMKCKKDGKLLFCSEKSCVVVLHLECVGRLPTFDAKGDFFCPFCTLSHAYEDQERAKKEANDARSKVTAFFCNQD